MIQKKQKKTDTVIHKPHLIEAEGVGSKNTQACSPLLKPSIDKWRAFFTLKEAFDTELIQLLGMDRAGELSHLLDKLKPKYPFRKCYFNDYGHDLKKRWYIDFWVWNIVESKMERRRQFVPMSIKTVWQRNEWAAEFMAEIDQELENGKVRNPQKQEKPAPVFYFWDCIKEALAYKEKNIANRKTMIGYEYVVNLIQLWLAESGKLKILVQDFGKQDAYKLFDWIDEYKFQERGTRISFRTYNNYYVYIHSLFEYLTKKDYYLKNPIACIEKKTVVEPPNFPFMESQKELLLQEMKAQNRIMLIYFCRFMYYTLTRPTEIIKLKRKYFYPDKIQVPGTIGKKSRKRQWIPITDACRELLDEMGIWDLPPESYIFGDSGIGSKTQKPENSFGREHTQIRLKVGLSSDYNMYSWKDTGACDLYKATRDIKYVSEMCRHHSISQTEIYLRSMGMITNKENAERAPKLNV